LWHDVPSPSLSPEPMGKATRHSCEWYPISYDPSTRPYEPVLWACGAQWGCLKTETRQPKGRGKGRVLTGPSPIIETPTTGMWAIVPDVPQED
jgi:hypothetical protein